MVEGHVAQAVGVQVPPSALRRQKCLLFLWELTVQPGDWVDRGSINIYFKMQVRTAGASGVADMRDELTRLDLIAFFHLKIFQVHVN